MKAKTLKDLLNTLDDDDEVFIEGSEVAIVPNEVTLVINGKSVTISATAEGGPNG